MEGGSQTATVLDSNGDTVATQTLTEVETLIGSAGNDTFALTSASGMVSLNGGAGTNTLDLSELDVGISVDAGTGIAAAAYTIPYVEFANVENFTVFKSSIGSFTLNGSAGDETLVVGQGTTYLSFDGGEGADTLDFSGIQNGHHVDASLEVIRVYDAQDGDFCEVDATDIDTLIGSSGNDVFAHIPGIAFLGGAGNDTYEAGEGNDIFNGGRRQRHGDIRRQRGS